MRPNDRAIDGKQAPIDAAIVHLAGLETAQDFVPEATPRPRPKAIINRLPWSELRRQIAPAAAIGKSPENTIDHEPMVLPLPATVAIIGQKVLNLAPLIVRKPVGRGSNGHQPLLGNELRIPFATLYHNAFGFTRHDLV